MSNLKKKRKGNMVLVVVILVMLSLTLSGLLSINTAQKNNAREKAEDAGETNTYIALANMCADAFRDDIEAQNMRKVVATVENPSGEIEYGIEVYDEAIAAIQTALTKDRDTPLENGAFQHTLTTPFDAVEYAGVSDQDALDFMDTLLADAQVTIIAANDLYVYLEDDDSANLQNGDSVSIGDIVFSVELSKGTWKVNQVYRLSGLQLNGRFSDTQLLFSVDGSSATCQLESQTVTRRNINAIETTT